MRIHGLREVELSAELEQKRGSPVVSFRDVYANQTAAPCWTAGDLSTVMTLPRTLTRCTGPGRNSDVTPPAWARTPLHVL